MATTTSLLSAAHAEGLTLRVAAAGDIHCSEATRDAVTAAFRAIDGTVDLILLAGDLTTHGRPEEAAVLGDVCRSLESRVVCVLGNHDLHCGMRDEVAATLVEAGIEVLDRSFTTCAVAGKEVGIAGAKGFVGGFHGRGLPDFGEPSLRGIYAETTEEVEALAHGLREIATCPFRIVLLHYSPTADTLHGEPPEIWTFLGSDRLAAPILEHRPDLVLHGHAHAGRFEASLDGVPVYNVSVPVMRQDFWVFELTGAERTSSPIH